MRTTIKDVAKLAGVSPATVSLVMNKKNVAVKESTRQAVLDAAQELNYRPNQLAVGLVTNKSYSIGLILPDAENPFFSSLAKYIEQTAMQYGYAVVTSNTDDDCEKTCKYLRFFSDRQVDGIILVQSDFHSPQDTDKIFQLIADSYIPIVLVDRVFEGHELPAVLVDQQRIGYLATQHLLEQGHRRIGCITGPLGIYSTKERLMGYKKAMEEYGLEYNSSLIYQGKYDIRTGEEAAPFLLGKKVSAVFCFADYIAFGVYRELRNLNRNIPEDLSVVGVDDTILADIIQPPLTTVEQPVQKIAKLAVKQIVERINHPDLDATPQPLLEPILKVRSSVRQISDD